MFYSCVHGTCTYLYHVYSKRYQIVIVTRNQNFEIFKSVIDFRRYRTCAYCEWCGLLNARNSSKYICTGNFLNIIGTMWTHHFMSCLTMITCSKTIFFPGMPLSGICYLTAWGSLVTTPFDWIPI